MLTTYGSDPNKSPISTPSMQAVFEKATRYYAMMLQQDLLEDWVVVVDNGRNGSKLGQRRTIAFLNYPNAFEHFCSLASIRYKRNYRCVSYSASNLFFDFLCRIQALNMPRTITLSPKIEKRQKKSMPIEQLHIETLTMQQLALRF